MESRQDNERKMRRSQYGHKLVITY